MKQHQSSHHRERRRVGTREHQEERVAGDEPRDLIFHVPAAGGTASLRRTMGRKQHVLELMMRSCVSCTSALARTLRELGLHQGAGFCSASVDVEISWTSCVSKAWP